jgi:hypothetical protein
MLCWLVRQEPSMESPTLASTRSPESLRDCLQLAERLNGSISQRYSP